MRGSKAALIPKCINPTKEVGGSFYLRSNNSACRIHTHQKHHVPTSSYLTNEAAFTIGLSLPPEEVGCRKLGSSLVVLILALRSVSSMSWSTYFKKRTASTLQKILFVRVKHTTTNPYTQHFRLNLLFWLALLLSPIPIHLLTI